jgi:hypothetical protein
MSMSLVLLLDTSLEPQKILDVFIEPYTSQVNHVHYFDSEKMAEATVSGTLISFRPILSKKLHLNKHWTIRGYVPLQDEVADEETKLIVRLILDFTRRSKTDIVLRFNGSNNMISHINNHLALHHTNLKGKQYWWDVLNLTEELAGLEYSIVEEE